MKKLLPITFLFIIWLSKSVFAMDVYIVGSGDSFCSQDIYLVGEIKPNDASKIITSITNAKKTFKPDSCPLGGKVVLDSIGGDVDSALQLGRYFKNQKMSVKVSIGHPIFTNNKFDVDINQPGVCYSSCVFILAGGVNRTVITSRSKVGIHRPYFYDLEGNPSALQIKALRDKVLQNIRAYLDEMDINQTLAESSETKL